MRKHIVNGGPNAGSKIEINQEFLFRGTNYLAFQRHIKDGKYWGSYDKKFSFSTFVATNIDGAASYCGQHYSLLLAIAHRNYFLESPESAEGLIILGRISLEDVVLVTTNAILSRVIPPYERENLDDAALQRIRQRASITY